MMAQIRRKTPVYTCLRIEMVGTWLDLDGFGFSGLFCFLSVSVSPNVYLVCFYLFLSVLVSLFSSGTVFYQFKLSQLAPIFKSK